MLIYSSMKSFGWILLLVGAVGLGVVFPFMFLVYAIIIGAAFLTD